jgi:methyl-accepting chemotaxis protein
LCGKSSGEVPDTRTTETGLMSGETGQLQRLTDEQVSARLAAYADGGRFEANLQWLWEQAGDVIEEVSRAHLGDEAVSYERDRFTHPINADWIRKVAEYGVMMYTAKVSVPQFVAARAVVTGEILRRVDERFADSPENRVRAVDTMCRAQSFCGDILLAQIALLEANDAAETRGRESEQFERRVGELVRASTDQSKSLTSLL